MRRPPEPNRAYLLMLAHSYEAAKDIGPQRGDRKQDGFEIARRPDEPAYTARQRGTDARHSFMWDIHRAWQYLYRTDEIGIWVNPVRDPDTGKHEIGGEFLAFVRVLWADAGLDPPPARTVYNIITGH